MNDRQISELLSQYEHSLDLLKATPTEANFDTVPSKLEAFNHLLSMIPRMRTFLKDGQRDKLMRWLGFMQGVLWANGRFTLNQLRQHNTSQAERK